MYRPDPLLWREEGGGVVDHLLGIHAPADSPEYRRTALHNHNLTVLKKMTRLGLVYRDEAIILG